MAFPSPWNIDFLDPFAFRAMMERWGPIWEAQRFRDFAFERGLRKDRKEHYHPTPGYSQRMEK